MQCKPITSDPLSGGLERAGLGGHVTGRGAEGAASNVDMKETGSRRALLSSYGANHCAGSDAALSGFGSQAARGL